MLDALGQIVGESADALRTAGQAIRPGGAPIVDTGAAFARRGSADQIEAPAEKHPEAPETDWDEVDWLFRGA